MAAKTALGNGSNAWLIVTDATMRTRAETRPVSGWNDLISCHDGTNRRTGIFIQKHVANRIKLYLSAESDLESAPEQSFCSLMSHLVRTEKVIRRCLQAPEEKNMPISDIVVLAIAKCLFTDMPAPPISIFQPWHTYVCDQFSSSSVSPNIALVQCLGHWKRNAEGNYSYLKWVD